MSVSHPALELNDVHKRFGETAALDGASLTLRPGTIHALVGENGAGKTTLMRVACGLLRADSGTLRVLGRAIQPRNPTDALEAGIGMVHQHFALVERMRVTENVALGGRGLFREKEMAARVATAASDAGLAATPLALVEDLGIADRQRVEIIKAMARDARVLVLDEPTAVLPPDESRDLLLWLQAFVAKGRSAILITHRLRDALAVADDITVMRHGRTVLATPASGTTADAIAVAMLGSDSMPALMPAPPTMIGEAVVEARQLELQDERGIVRVRGATFTLHCGEIIAVAGVEGAGQRELLRALAGRARIAAGKLKLPESIGFIPEDRHREALILELSLLDNVDLRGASRRSGWRRLRRREERLRALLSEFDVRASGPSARVATLSGGNQQKLVLARELSPRPALVVAEHPTRGLDLRASAAVRARLAAAAAEGTTVVVASHDLDELAAMAGRALVLHAGQVREVSVDVATIGRAMVGA